MFLTAILCVHTAYQQGTCLRVDLPGLDIYSFLFIVSISLFQGKRLVSNIIFDIYSMLKWLVIAVLSLLESVDRQVETSYDF